MTKKLFWEDATQSSFKSKILSVEVYEKDPSKFTVVMDETAFYPEGGGQPWDEGTIGGMKVSYVYEEQGVIYHVLDQTATIDSNVTCEIDWNRRFDHMQQHLGQHILSAAFENLYSASTVGFHLGTEFVTIDVTKDSLSYDEVVQIEAEANQIIFNNLKVSSHFPSVEELKNLPLRKAPTVTEGIRIIEIENYDYSPCGGTHPTHTGAVGLIKIRRWEKMKGQIRVEFVCGLRALKDYSWKNRQINEISNQLSIRDIETQEFVEKMIDENKTLSKTIRTFKKDLQDYQVKELYQSAEIHKDYSLVVKIFDGLDFKDLQSMANSLNQYSKTIALLATKNDKAQIVFTRSKDVEINIGNLFKEVIGLIEGKGGGSPQTAQGGGSDLANLDGLMTAAVLKIKKDYLS
ncbi:alanyl-tRNA editing protein [Alkaliphilus transvaalensis]|uniref:alanyl-tRNA editing protein n=1 Tax=Alkaliphilus transvaalensis TaxID=114628 RepID=UPI00047E4A87|nr:DHHA1 domain-containing protein [Alkaliphilus transvaalensis]